LPEETPHEQHCSLPRVAAGHEKPEVMRGVDEHQILVGLPIDPVEGRVGVIGPAVRTERLHLGTEALDGGGVVGVGSDWTGPAAAGAGAGAGVVV
jgi:hypothetical protein